MQTVVLLVLVSVVLWVARAIVGYVRITRAINNHPGVRTVFNLGPWIAFLPRIPYVTVPKKESWSRRYGVFEDYGVDIVSYASAIPTPTADFLVADPAVVKEITSSRQRFPKPVRMYQGLLFYGNNIVASEADEWKRFRKICGPSFSEPNNRLVWDETVSIMNDLFKNVWGDKKEVVYEHALELTMPLALFVIGAAGFGRRMSWNEELAPENLQKGQLSLKDTLHAVSEGMIIKVVVPKWALPLKKRFREVKFAYEELERHMHEMIKTRRTAEKKVERYDLLSSLLDANDDSASSASKLDDQELLANIFVFLIAGHETTAHTLCFCLGLLALYQDEQERTHHAIKKAIPDNRDPTFQDLADLTYVEAVMNETLRMFPPAIGIPKVSVEDTTLTTTNSAGEPVVVPVPKGSALSIYVIGMHYNPKHWKDPHSFKPSRFLEDWPRDAFLPFSGGVRSCLGRRFAELESIVAITMILQKYKITVKEDPAFVGETFEQKKDRVLKMTQGLTLTPVRTPLVFTRRG